MDATRLRTFSSVVRAGSIRGAAQSLNYSPASVSQQIAQLQRDTGLTLFTRVGRGIEPTPTGLALAARVELFLGELNALEDFIDGLRGGFHTTFTICHFSSLGSAWMPTLLSTLDQEFPQTRLEVRVRDDFEEDARPLADLQLVATPGSRQAPPGYQAVPLLSDPYVVALPTGHRLLAMPGAVPLADLRAERWIDTNAGVGSCRQITVDACTTAGFHPSFHLQAQDYPTAMSLVAVGLGIAVLPSLGARQVPPGVEIKELQPPAPSRTISALVNRAQVRSTLARRAVEITLSLAGSAH